MEGVLAKLALSVDLVACFCGSVQCVGEFNSMSSALVVRLIGVESEKVLFVGGSDVQVGRYINVAVDAVCWRLNDVGFEKKKSLI